jgi:CheY-like chemotaxis protein
MAGPAVTAMTLRVLLVDDDPLARLLTSRLLEQQGTRVVQASGGREALRRAGLETFDVILLDIHMPEVDGLTAARSLRDSGVSGRIIGLTGDHQVARGLVWKSVGMDACFTKPFQLEPFLEFLRATKPVDRVAIPTA